MSCICVNNIIIIIIIGKNESLTAESKNKIVTGIFNQRKEKSLFSFFFPYKAFWELDIDHIRWRLICQLRLNKTEATVKLTNGKGNKWGKVTYVYKFLLSVNLHSMWNIVEL